MSGIKRTFFPGLPAGFISYSHQARAMACGRLSRPSGRCCENGHGADVDLEAAAQKYLDGYRYGSLECREAYLRYREKLPSEWDSRKVLT